MFFFIQNGILSLVFLDTKYFLYIRNIEAIQNLQVSLTPDRYRNSNDTLLNWTLSRNYLVEPQNILPAMLLILYCLDVHFAFTIHDEYMIGNRCEKWDANYKKYPIRIKYPKLLPNYINLGLFIVCDVC